MDRQKLELILEAINDAQEVMRVLTGGNYVASKLESAEWAILDELNKKAEPKKRKPGRPKKTSR
jgi:hypothetical protein